ncbi:hypothetical protein T10_106 [Trichinella papuae]|uniref:DNA endonuclease activator Ctp1 C-terminal domain-containing protein n=1 Tax=Trichinella papuae TaxID=268474 RepID=A0A0V1N1W7_9BILA|nr:hypothetical protein T10_106 [Trichinella papuae]
MSNEMNATMNIISTKEKSETKFTSIFSNLNEDLAGDVDFEIGSPKNTQPDPSEQQSTVCGRGDGKNFETIDNDQRGRKRKKRHNKRRSFGKNPPPKRSKPPTPEHFWDVGFPSDGEIESRELIFRRRCSND